MCGLTFIATRKLAAITRVCAAEIIENPDRFFGQEVVIEGFWVGRGSRESGIADERFTKQPRVAPKHTIRLIARGLGAEYTYCAMQHGFNLPGRFRGLLVRSKANDAVADLCEIKEITLLTTNGLVAVDPYGCDTPRQSLISWTWLRHPNDEDARIPSEEQREQLIRTIYDHRRW